MIKKTQINSNIPERLNTVLVPFLLIREEAKKQEKIPPMI